MQNAAPGVCGFLPGYTCAGGPIQQHTLGWLDAQALEPFFVSHWQHHSLHQFLNLFIEASNVAVVFCGLFIYLHQQHFPGIVNLLVVTD